MSSADDSHATTAPTLQLWSGGDAEHGAISYCRCNTILVNLEDCGLCESETYFSCLFSALYFFFCHATATVILHICCCRCFASLLETPDELEPRNNAQKVLLFFVKQLSNFWASALLFLLAWLVFFRPFDVTPTLGASFVYEFELQEQPPGTGTMVGPSLAPQLRFNLSAHLLLKNTHVFYSIRYNHPAMAVFYAGEKLGPSDDMLPPLKQEPLEWTVLEQVVVGRLRNASGRLADAYRDELSQGQFQMLVKFWVNLTYKFWPFKAEYFYVYECPLLSPVPHRAGEPDALSKPASCTRGAV